MSTKMVPVNSRTKLGEATSGTLDNYQRCKSMVDTFSKPSPVGWWTNADAQTHFDKFEAAQIKR